LRSPNPTKRSTAATYTARACSPSSACGCGRRPTSCPKGPELTAEQLSIILGKGGDVGALAMKVDSEIHHAWASFLSFVLGARYAVSTGAEARSFMASAAPEPKRDGRGVLDLCPGQGCGGPGRRTRLIEELAIKERPIL